MAVKIGFLFLGAGAVIGMQEAIFADVGVAFYRNFFSVATVRNVTHFFKQKTAYEIMSGDWSSDVCSSDLDKS